MSKYYYSKKNRIHIRTLFRGLSLLLVAIGLLGVGYVFFPLLSWQIYFEPVFAAQNIAAPIPKTTIVNADTIQSLISQASQALSGIDYSNAQNWFPTYAPKNANKAKIATYLLSVPKLSITNAIVSTIDNNLTSHLVNYAGTAVPPDNGNAVIFGHSTLPQLFDPKNYKTIFANAHELHIGDTIILDVSGVTYTYKIFSITIVDPTDTSVLSQNYDNSYVTIVTCTPPGTTWKRLIIKSRIEKT